MPYSVTPNSDFFMLDNLVPVTVRPSSDEDGVEVEHAWRSFVTTKEAAASNGQYTTRDVVWHLHMDEYPTPPLPSYQVIEADEESGTDVVWTALAVKRCDFDSRWRLVCRDLVIEERLDSRITILAATRYEKGEAGDAQPAYADWKAGVLANITLDRIERRNDSGVMIENAQYSITLGEPVDFSPLDASDIRVADQSGRLFMVTLIERSNRIDFLPVLYCEAMGPFGSES